MNIFFAPTFLQPPHALQNLTILNLLTQKLPYMPIYFFLFRHAGVSSTYPCQMFVRPFVGP